MPPKQCCWLDEADSSRVQMACGAAQVRELLHKRVRDSYLHPQFATDVLKPLNIEPLLDQEVRAVWR